MKNPFTIKVIPHDAPFCNREKEQRELLDYAQNKTHVVVFSPRRFGRPPWSNVSSTRPPKTAW